MPTTILSAPRSVRRDRRSGGRSRLAVTRRLSQAFALVAAVSVVGMPRVARADEVSPTGKGIAGGALLGGEVVVFGEALFGVRSGLAYGLGALGGAAAGGVGGYFVEQSVSDGRIPAYLLAGGLALVVPALVVTLDATRFRPAEGAREDKGAPAPASDPGKLGGSSVVGAPTAAPPGPATSPATPPPAGGAGTGTPAPTSLFDVQVAPRGGDFRMGVPLPDVRPVFTVAEKKAYGVESKATELRFPVVKVTF